MVVVMEGGQALFGQSGVFTEDFVKLRVIAVDIGAVRVLPEEADLVLVAVAPYLPGQFRGKAPVFPDPPLAVDHQMPVAAHQIVGKDTGGAQHGGGGGRAAGGRGGEHAVCLEQAQGLHGAGGKFFPAARQIRFRQCRMPPV